VPPDYWPAFHGEEWMPKFQGIFFFFLIFLLLIKAFILLDGPVLIGTFQVTIVKLVTHQVVVVPVAMILAVWKSLALYATVIASATVQIPQIVVQTTFHIVKVSQIINI